MCVLASIPSLNDANALGVANQILNTSLAAMLAPVIDVDMIQYILHGLGKDYASFVTLVNTRVELILIDDLLGMLLCE